MCMWVLVGNVMGRNTTIRCEAFDQDQFAADLNELIKLANENGVPREEIKRILETNADYVDSERGREQLDGYEDMEIA